MCSNQLYTSAYTNSDLTRVHVVCCRVGFGFRDWTDLFPQFNDIFGYGKHSSILWQVGDEFLWHGWMTVHCADCADVSLSKLTNWLSEYNVMIRWHQVRRSASRHMITDAPVSLRMYPSFVIRWLTGSCNTFLSASYTWSPRAQHKKLWSRWICIYILFWLIL